MKSDSMIGFGGTEGGGLSLRGLPEGASVFVVGVDAEGTELARLEAMGLCAGRTVDVVKSGDPMIVRVLGTRIGLAGRLAGDIRVQRHD